MSTVATPPPSGKKVNIIGLESTAYRGAKTTLCAGCGHNAITERIIDSFFELGVQPDQAIKLSGTGCPSNSTAEFRRPMAAFREYAAPLPTQRTPLSGAPGQRGTAPAKHQ